MFKIRSGFDFLLCHRLDNVVLNLTFYILLVCFVYAVIYTERDDNTSRLYDRVKNSVTGRTFPTLYEVGYCHI